MKASKQNQSSQRETLCASGSVTRNLFFIISQYSFAFNSLFKNLTTEVKQQNKSRSSRDKFKKFV